MRRAAQTAGRDNLVIVNTCAVTAEAARQARQTIRRLKREAPERTIIVTGCAAQTAPQSFAAMPEVAKVLGNAEKPSAEAFRPGTPERVAVGDIFAAAAAPPPALGRRRGSYPRLSRHPDRLRSSLHLLHHPLWPGAVALDADGGDRRRGPANCVAEGFQRDRADRRRSHRLWPRHRRRAPASAGW